MPAAFVAAMYLKQEASAAPVVETPAHGDRTGPADRAGPAPPRIVSHEGVVRHVTSVIVPTEYELYDPITGLNIDFLYPGSATLDLSHYSGKRVVVTGEEGLAARWKNTPVLTVQNIQVISEPINAASQYHTVTSPRGGQRH